MELDRCVYNSMAGGPYATVKKYNGMKVFKDNRYKCEYCRETDIVKVQSAHFTLCQKPWNCFRSVIEQICTKFCAEWFRIRKDLEETWDR